MSLATKIEKWICRLLQMPTCQELETNYYDYLAQALDAKSRRKVKRHLRLCKRCRKFFESYKLTVDLSSQWGALWVPLKKPEQIFERISGKLKS